MKPLILFLFLAVGFARVFANVDIAALERRASEGDAAAQNELGARYQAGDGVAKDEANYQGDGMHWVEYDIGAGTLALGMAPAMKPSATGCSVSLEVVDFDQAVAELKAAGTQFIFGPFDTGVCHMAFVSDPDGNSVGIHKRK